MAAIKDRRKEKFAQLLSVGDKTESECYRLVYPASKKWKPKTLWSRASELSREVLGRVQELRKQAEAQTIIDTRELVSYLARAVRTPIGAVGVFDPLAHEHRRIETSRGTVSEVIRSFPKDRAVDMLMKHLGAYAPEKQEGDLTLKFIPDSDTMTILQEAKARSKK